MQDVKKIISNEENIKKIEQAYTKYCNGEKKIVEYLSHHKIKDVSLVARFCDFNRCVLGVANEQEEFDETQCEKFFFVRHQHRPALDHYTITQIKT